MVVLTSLMERVLGEMKKKGREEWKREEDEEEEEEKQMSLVEPNRAGGT